MNIRTPKFIKKILFLLIQAPRIFCYQILSNARVFGKMPKLRQPLHAVGHGLIQFESGVTIGFFPSPYFFSSCAFMDVRNVSSVISIGSNTSINNGFVAIAEYSHIKIGSRVLMGTNVEIIDSDFHGIRLADRNLSKPEWAKPVVIEDDVFLGSNVRVCKGVTIGAGSVIANGAIVVKDIPPGVLAAGNPASVVRSIVDEI